MSYPARLLLLVSYLLLPQLAHADITRLIDAPTILALAEESSGTVAKRNLDTITLFHRTRASSQFRAAAEHVYKSLRGYGIKDVRMLHYPADGKTMFGTQKSRPAWDVEFAELWELDQQGQRVRRFGDWAAMPLSVAQDSVSGEVTARLVDIGAGSDDADYADKELRGRLVLTSSQPGAVVERAVGELGAVGIVSYAPNQKSAWWLEDDRLVRWGHMGTFSKTKSFGFMISLGQARDLQARMEAGEQLRFQATIKATQKEGRYTLVSARIPGTDEAVADEEIVFTCHLDHPRPGANDNASGCVSILESARTLHTLIAAGALPPPRRSLRFLWPAEIEGSLIYLSSLKSTDHIKSNIHLDMVGGGQQTKSVFRISGGPMSLPSFVADLGHEIGNFVNQQTLSYASGDGAAYPLVSREGSKNPQLGIMEGISMGSDHQVFNAGSWGIPGIYLHDWPDRYIHTNFDTAAMIDPTKLKRAAFIAALQGWYLATFDDEDVTPLLELLRANALQRYRDQWLDLSALSPADQVAVRQVLAAVELGKVASINEYSELSAKQEAAAEAFIEGLDQLTGSSAATAVASNNDDRIYQRNPAIKGTMHAFGYSYLEDHLPAADYAGLTFSGEKAYEALNLVDGVRSVSEIRSWLLAEFGPVDQAALTDYLQALESIDVIR
ncbi:MAG: M28 family peptidase [Marinobacter sp.]|uniref:M28 family peptidase n=1 Tax=Marinobacter sp. TaxID=50741 RepID=UPI003299BB16